MRVIHKDISLFKIGNMKIANVYASILTTDAEKSYKWYKKLFNRGSDFNPMKGHHEWNFPNGGVLQLFEDKERAGYSSITLMVDNRVEQIKQLESLDMPLGRKTASNVAKTITIFDPENNRITFAEKVS